MEMLSVPSEEIGDNKLVSVIVPIYKVEECLQRCIESILKQDYTNFELVLVDDGSPDKCGEICDLYASKDSRIRVIHKENGGLSDARNAGIDVAKGEYLTFVDSDDYIEPDYISYLYKLIHMDDSCKISHANHYIHRGDKITTDAPVKGEISIFSQKEAIEAALYYDRVNVCVWGGFITKAYLIMFDFLREGYMRILIYSATKLSKRIAMYTETNLNITMSRDRTPL